MTLSRSAELLKALIAFPTISRTPNLALNWLRVSVHCERKNYDDRW
ncbi:hypothetical protein B0G69_7693 [Paraburkholderia sp. RAU2J]|nr:hypothetical protein [Paraburkholderia sp. RAU2J]RKT10328.1 hypothetical protein B0G69_7693 [Paraburkholderia sp. RAU2J]